MSESKSAPQYLEEKRAKGSPHGAEHEGERKAQELLASIPSIDHVVDVTRDVREGIIDYAKKNPAVALGIAAGAGFALGSVLGSRVGKTVLTVVTGYAMQSLLGDDGVQKLVTGGINRILVARSSKR